MIALINFEVKKFFKRRKNIISLIIFFIFILLYVTLSISLEKSKLNSKTIGYDNELKSHQDSYLQLKQVYAEREIPEVKELLDRADKLIAIINNRNNAFRQNDWKTELSMQIKLDAQLLNDIEMGNVVSGANPEELKNNIEKNQILYDKNIKPIIEENSMTSYNFIRLVSRDILPLFLTIIILLLSADIISTENDEGTFKILLVHPISRSKILLSKIISITLICVSYVASILFAFFIGLGLLRGFGSPNYPTEYSPKSLTNLFSNTANSSAIKTMNVSTFIVYIIPMLILLIIAISSLGLLISILITNSTASICTSIIIAVGVNTLTIKLELFKEIAKFLPFTYSNIPTILYSGMLKASYNYFMGILVLTLFTLICYAISIIVFTKKDIVC